MATSPLVGEVSGQRYDLPRAIRTLLQEMGKGIAVGSALVKELLQNADDAGASILVLVLDERTPHPDMVRQLDGLGLSALKRLLEPGLLVRNDAPFRKQEDGEGHDDFRALRTVAEGHKLGQLTAAGRFGIGFNSVYFVTDTPMIFSRQEVHVFDPLGRCFGKDGGWRFRFEDFQAKQSRVGVQKQMLAWCLPSQGLSLASFDTLAREMRDYPQAVLRLPFRRLDGGSDPLYPRHLAEDGDRSELLQEMLTTAARSLVFLKRLRIVEVARLDDAGYRILGTVRAEDRARDRAWDLKPFHGQVEERAPPWMEGASCLDADTGYYRHVVEIDATGLGHGRQERTFLVRQQARFECEELQRAAERLHRNRERAIPWVGAAFPCDLGSFEESDPSWRVFLPIVQQGPCGAMLHLAGFVDPSRQGLEHRLQGSDEELRKTDWNRALVEKALTPLLQDASLNLLQELPGLVREDPRRYLSLLPGLPARAEQASIARHLQEAFHRGNAWIQVPDLWGDPIHLMTADDHPSETLERIPNWLASYGDRFIELRSKSRRFVSHALGDALAARLGSRRVQSGPGADVYRWVLEGEQPPKPNHLDDLVDGALKASGTAADLDGLWALSRAPDGDLVRFRTEALYLVQESGELPEPLAAVQAAGLAFEGFEVVQPNRGLANRRRRSLVALDNMIDDVGRIVPAALTRLKLGSRHDSPLRRERLTPLVDFLCETDPRNLPEQVSLAFLVATAHAKANRRDLGTVFLKPEAGEDEAKALWEGLLRRVFAEVAPGASSEHVRRLLSKHPQLQRRLDSEDGCRLERVRPGRMLEVLHRALQARPEVVAEMASALRKAGPERAERAAGILLAEGQERWDNLGEELRRTVCRLPIHRTSEGDLVALLSGDDEELAAIPDRFLLQGEEQELRDAPVDAGQESVLLRRGRSATYRFYRDRLGIAPHGRASVLRLCLEQIGGEGVDNRKILHYVGTYFQATVEELRGSESSADQADADPLQRLLEKARLVPCTDDCWHAAAETVAAWECEALLSRKKWGESERRDLMAGLASPLAVAACEKELRAVLEGLAPNWVVWAAEDLYWSSFTSDSGVGLAARARLMHDLRELDEPSKQRRVSEAVWEEMVPTQEGRLPLKETVLASGSLPVGLTRAFAPHALDLDALAREWRPVPKRAIPAILRALEVRTVNEEDFDQLVVLHLGDRWQAMGETERMDTLEYVAQRPNLAGQIRDAAAGLEVVATVPGGWSAPGPVLAHEWLATKPPGLGAATLPRTKGASTQVLDLWGEWSERREVDGVVGMVVKAVADSGAPKSQRVRELYAWLGRAADKVGPGPVAKALGSRAWVLADRGTERELRRPAEVLVHKASALLRKEFWCPTDDLHQLPVALRDRLPFLREPLGDPDSLERVARCLEAADEVSAEVACAVYRLAKGLVVRTELEELWPKIAERRALFRLFRKPERTVDASQVFLGDQQQGSTSASCSSVSAPQSFQRICSRPTTRWVWSARRPRGTQRWHWPG